MSHNAEKQTTFTAHYMLGKSSVHGQLLCGCQLKSFTHYNVYKMTHNNHAYPPIPTPKDHTLECVQSINIYSSNLLSAQSCQI